MDAWCPLQYLRDFLTKCFMKNPVFRPSAVELLEVRLLACWDAEAAACVVLFVVLCYLTSAGLASGRRRHPALYTLVLSACCCVLLCVVCVLCVLFVCCVCECVSLVAQSAVDVAQ